LKVRVQQSDGIAVVSGGRVWVRTVAGIDRLRSAGVVAEKKRSMMRKLVGGWPQEED
jgi:hypothetical protein